MPAGATSASPPTLDGPFATPTVDYRLSAAAAGFGAMGIEGVQASGRATIDADRIRIPVNATARRVTGLNAAAGGLLTNIAINGNLAYIERPADLRQSAAALGPDRRHRDRRRRFRQGHLHRRAEGPGQRLSGRRARPDQPRHRCQARHRAEGRLRHQGPRARRDAAARQRLAARPARRQCGRHRRCRLRRGWRRQRRATCA